MKLFFVRHGETVDNIAQLYAGVTDSALTVHGSLQATRLGAHLAATQPPITHLFSSDLCRARRTAEAVLAAQDKQDGGAAIEALRLVQLPLLQEQDFGSHERLPVTERLRSRQNESSESREGSLKRALRPGESGFRDVESKASLAIRVNSFLDGYLLPLLPAEDVDIKGELVVVVVSHGILLSVLWKCLVKRFAPYSVTLGSEVQLRNGSGEGVPADLTHLGGWGNTGYLHLRIRQLDQEFRAPETASKIETSAGVESDTSSGGLLYDYSLHVAAVNCRDHLRGLKRTGGGVGSSKFDEGQQSIDSFFAKKRRTC